MAKVTLSGTPSFVESNQWPQFVSAIEEHLPLQNLHWKSATRPSIRTIHQLSIALCSFDSSVLDVRPESLILDHPVLNIYALACEVSSIFACNLDLFKPSVQDIEAYKATMRKQLQEWRASLVSQPHQEWLVVLVSTPDTATGNKKRFQMKGSVLDRLRADFNSEKRDRCAHLVWSGNARDPTLWADFVSKMKEGIVAYLDAQTSAREEELRRMEGLRQLEGWSFATFCVLKVRSILQAVLVVFFSSYYPRMHSRVHS